MKFVLAVYEGKYEVLGHLSTTSTLKRTGPGCFAVVCISRLNFGTRARLHKAVKVIIKKTRGKWEWFGWAYEANLQLWSSAALPERPERPERS